MIWQENRVCCSWVQLGHIVGARQEKNFDLARKIADAVPLLRLIILPKNRVSCCYSSLFFGGISLTTSYKAVVGG